MRYELSLKLSQENLHEMAPISMIRSSTVHDLATRTSSGSLSSHMFTSRRPCISHQPYIITTIVNLKCLLLKISMQDWFEVSASTHSYITHSSRTSRYVTLWKPLKALHHICRGTEAYPFKFIHNIFVIHWYSLDFYCFQIITDTEVSYHDICTLVMHINV